MSLTIPTPKDLAAADAQALGGTRHTSSKIPFVAKGTEPTAATPLDAQVNNVFEHIYDRLETSLRAMADGALTVGVYPGRLRNSSDTELLYEGSSGNALTNNATNYVYLDITTDPPTLVINTTGFPGTKTTFIPLAVYVTSGGAITTSDYDADRRGWVRNWVTAASSSPSGTDGTSFTGDQDNAGAGANFQYRANRGSTDAEDACLEWDETNDRWNVRAQHSTSTLAPVNASAVQISGTALLDSNGVTKVASGAAGSGLTSTAGVLSVNTDGTTLEISGGNARLMDGGVSTAKLSDAVADRLVQVVIPDSSGASPRDITVQVKDIQGNNLAEVVYLQVGVYQDADAAANATNATIAVNGVGTLVKSVTATKVLVCKTDSSGALALRITDGTAETVYVVAAATTRSRMLDCADIGTIVVS